MWLPGRLLVGVLASISVFSIAIGYLGLSLVTIFDVVALLTVVGGTLCVGLVTLPWGTGKSGLGFYFKKVLSGGGTWRLDFVRASKDFQNSKLLKQTAQACGLPGEILWKAQECERLGLSLDETKAILESYAISRSREWHRVGTSVKNLAKYPPALGLGGTVLGLIDLMRSMSLDASPSSLGVRMSLALLATFYGIITSNILVAPLGELIMKQHAEAEDMADVALKLCEMKWKNENPFVQRQVLEQSFVGKAA